MTDPSPHIQVLNLAEKLRQARGLYPWAGRIGDLIREVVIQWAAEDRVPLPEVPPTERTTSLARRRQQVLEYVAGRGRQGATCHETQTATGLSTQVVSARLWELVQEGTLRVRARPRTGRGQRPRNATTVFVRRKS